MSGLQVAYEDGYRVYRTETGIDRQYVGPVWPTPRGAATYIETLRGIHRVSPLRAPGESGVSLPPSPDSPGVLTGVAPDDPGK